jgi:phage I-like protein
MTSLPRELVVVALASVIAILGMIALLVWPSRTSVAPTAAPTAAPAPPAGLAVSREEETETTKKETTAPPRETSPAVAEAPPPAAVGGSSRSAPRAAVSLVEAKLCRSLSTSDWQCTLLTSPAAPGRVFFYTRVKAGRDTTVQHRWYINGNLLQNVELRIGANAGAGFRTYSRNTVAAERSGTWTIELRDASGALLHEERFVVQ